MIRQTPAYAFAIALALSFSASLAAPALAAGPADTVAAFYQKIGSEVDPDTRSRFTGSAEAFLNEADAFWEAKQEPCISFGFSIDGQDYDEAEVAGSLALSEQLDGEAATVTATFSNFGRPTEIVWSLVKSGSDWLVSDIASTTTGWRVSDMACE